MLFLDKLEHTNDLTENEQRIATYIKDNLASVSEMSIQNLAAETYTSHSAIVRFAQKMNYDGYRSMRHDIIKAAQQQLSQLNDVDANFPFSEADTAIDVAKNIADLTINTVKKALTQLDEKSLAEAANKIVRSKRLVLFAFGDTQIRARSFQNKLVKINRFAILAEEYGDDSWTSVSLNSDDLAIFISYGGDSKQYLKIIRFLNKQKVPTLLITGNPDSKLKTFATQTILIVQDEYNFFKVSTFASQITFEYLLDTLFSIVYSKAYKDNLINLQNNYDKLTQNNILTT
ncbi:rpir family sialic acid utilization regulator [Companilactobacillus mindensis DSM 14500]|uniref:Rpir family sialic acid utilization regulator n=1 Tax=Companilactobacillus mindensis DSM 14500 TaxID=1423770 RepID=A0A0R1QMT2_9LACO|nr:MurR/RpiR family transcriptional regulator [Companilactobacillus mindensis]KRL46054.1 rpir family sialic acid utilization regulator [Companilactobacillus mindensis DSM 14500]GEO77997.1 RpiR family transcriptional regulator [Companilactobacillus mindensis]